MKLQADIEHAFAHRQMPEVLVQSRSPTTPEQHDALWLAGRDWRQVGWADWEKHPDAFFALVPEAFKYYLPSILIGLLEAPGHHMLAGDALLRVLDRSPQVSYWDAFITTRLFGLTVAEYEVLKAWLLSLSGQSQVLDEDGLMRSYETVDSLARETAKVRQMVADTDQRHTKR